MQPPTATPPSTNPTSATAAAPRATTQHARPVVSRAAASAFATTPLQKVLADGWRQQWWGLAHVYTLTYPAKACRQKQAEARDFFLRGGIPLIFCGDCVMHYIRYIAHHPPPVTGQRVLAEWLIALHNNVNRRTGKPHDWTYERVAELYFGPEWRRIIDVWTNQGNAACPPMPPVLGPSPLDVQSIEQQSHRRGLRRGLALMGAVVLISSGAYFFATRRSSAPTTPPAPAPA